MSQGNDFANYAASDEASAASEDVWFVAVASDDIKQMTVDQLDEAFRLGVISAETQVWTEGMESWAPLGEVADLDGADASDSVLADEEETSIARMEYDSPAQQVAAPSYASMAAQHSAQPSPTGFASGPSSFAPVTSSFAPTTSSLSPAPLGLSSGPVALNVDEDMPALRRGRRFRPERWLLAAAAIAGVGVTAYNNSDIFSSSVAVAETAKAAPTALAARPYEAGGGVERGASLGSAKSGADEEDESAPGETGADGKGTTSPAPSSGAASAAMNDAKAEADGAEPPASAAKAAPAKESLKGSFSKAFNKKAPAAKPRAAKTRKTTARRAAAKPAKAAKKAGAPRAGSAFDPLNDSLP